MPFIKRSVSPVCLGNRRISDADKFDLTVVCNNALVRTLEQLASLTLHADSLFGELVQECHHVANRTKNIKERIEKIESYVDKLDFRTVQIPLGDLEKFEKVKDHYKTNYGIERNLLSPQTRPECVKELYDAADVSPLAIIRHCNRYRRDGRTGSQLFTIQPVFKDAVRDSFQELHDYKSKTTQYGSEEKDVHIGFRRIHQRPQSLSALKELQASEGNSGILQKKHATSPSGDFIAIDTSGSSFARLCQHREALRSASNECVIAEDSRRSRRRQKRRQTVSGVPQDVMDDLTKAFYVKEREARSLSRERLERPRSMAYLDRYAPRDERFYKSREELRKERIERESCVEPESSYLSRSCSLRRSMRSLFKGADKEKSQSMDLWAGGRPRSPGPPMIDLRQHVRRSRSLPRSLRSVKNSVAKLVKSRSASVEGRLDSESPSKDGATPAPNEFVTHVAKRKPRGLLRSMTKRMSKSQSNVSGVNRGSAMHKSMSESQCLRPQSLEFRMDSRLRAAIPVSSPTTPQSVESAPCTAAEQQAVGMKHRLNIPPGKAWKAFGGIRYRNPQQGRPRERQSSSGNWSGTDSVRYSTDSSQYTVTSRTSYDSAVSFNVDTSINERHSANVQDNTSTVSSVTTDGVSTINEEDTTAQEEDSDSTLNGSVIDAEHNSKLTADDWLTKAKPLEKRKRRRSRNKRTPDTRDVSLFGSNKLTLNNVKVHENTFRSALKIKLTDDESSVYSVDQDGFYTSMHLDSGLKTSTNDLIEEVTHDTLSTHVYDTKNGVKSTKKIPPLPPPRTSSCAKQKLSSMQSQFSLNSLNDQLDNLGLSTLSLNSTKSHDTSVSHQTDSSQLFSSKRDSVLSETDNEAIYARVKDKTNISTAGFPSLCSVTPLNSDEDDDISQIRREVKKKPMPEKQLPVVSQPRMESTHAKDVTASAQNRGSDIARGRSEPRQNSFKLMMKSMLDSDTERSFLITPVPNCPPPHPNTSTPSSKMSPAPFQRKDPRQNSYRMMINSVLESSYERSDKSMDDSVISLEFDVSGMELIDTSVYSTWPRNPKNKAPASPPIDKDIASKPELQCDDNVPALHVCDKKGLPGNEENLSNAKVNEPVQICKKDTKSGESRDKSKEKVVKPGRKKDHIAKERTSTWPKKGASSDHNSSIDDSSIEMTSKSYTDPSDQLSWTSTFPRRKKTSAQCLTPRKVPTTLPLRMNSGQPKAKSKEGCDAPLPQPAQARLIISSPLSTQAAYVDNPHKRSLCSPVSDRDFEFFSFAQEASRLHEQSAPFRVVKSSTMFDFKTPALQADLVQVQATPATDSRPISQPLFPSISAMKHSISFPQSAKQSDNYAVDKTWYDGTAEKENILEKSPRKADISISEHKLAHTGYPFASFLDESFLNTLESSDGKRLSRFSLISTNSSSSSGSGKKSSGFATDLKNSQSSLNKLDTISTGSGQTNCSDKSIYSRSSGGSLLAAFKTRRSLDSRTTSLGLKDKFKMKKSVASGSNIPLPPLPATKQDAGRQLKQSNAASSESLLQSPSQLKRSSAVLGDDFDVFSMAEESQPGIRNTAVTPAKKVSPTTDRLGQDFGPKRQCIGRAQSAPKGSPSKMQMLKRNRLRRSLSKNALHTIKVNPGSCEVIVLTPTHDSQNKTFVTANMLFTTENSFSQAILEHDPQKMCFDDSPQKLKLGESNTSAYFDSAETSKNVTQSGTCDEKSVKIAFEQAQAFVSTADSVRTSVQNLSLTNPIQHKDNNEKDVSAVERSVSSKPPSGKGPQISKSDKRVHPVKEKSKPNSVSKEQAMNDQKGNDQLHLVEKEACNIKGQMAPASKHSVSKSSVKANDLRISGNSDSRHNSKKLQAQSEKVCPKTSAFEGLELKGRITSQPTPPKFTLPKLREWKPSSAKKESKSIGKSDARRRGEYAPSSVNGGQSVNVSDSQGRNDTPSNTSKKNPSRFKSVSTVDLKSYESSKVTEMTEALYGSSTDISKRNTATVNDLRATGSMAKSLSNLSCLSLLRDSHLSMVYDSQQSLAKSTDSLASNSSVNADRVRSAKLAFLSQQKDIETKSKNTLDERFSRHTLGRSGRSGSNVSMSKLCLKSASCTSIHESTLTVHKNGTNNNCKEDSRAKCRDHSFVGERNHVSALLGKFENRKKKLIGHKNTEV